jgi:hypothetical protein
VHDGFGRLSFLSCTQCQDLRFSACVPVSHLVGVGRTPSADSFGGIVIWRNGVSSSLVLTGMVHGTVVR